MHVRCSVNVICDPQHPILMYAAYAVVLDSPRTQRLPESGASLYCSYSRCSPCHSVPMFFESESPCPFRPVPTCNNGRISTTSGLTVSCSHPVFENLKEEVASTPRDTGRCLEITGLWELVGQDVSGFEALAKTQKPLCLRGMAIYRKLRNYWGLRGLMRMLGLPKLLFWSFRDSRDHQPPPPPPHPTTPSHIWLPGQLFFFLSFDVVPNTPYLSSAVLPPHQ